MFRVYTIWLRTQRFESLQRYGAARAREARVTTEEDVERLIRAARRSR